MKSIVLLLAAVLPPVLGGQEPAPGASGAHAHAAPVATAAATRTPVRVDGVLDEAAWASAVPTTRFTQLLPLEGRPATRETEIRFLYDEAALYVGARMREPGTITARLGRRDMTPEANDWLAVILDSYHDHRTAFAFEVNPTGVRRDQVRSLGGEDESWDPVWEGETSVDSGGWTAELRIPFSQLRFSPGSEQRWGLQVERRAAAAGEVSVFAFTPSEQAGGIPAYGHLAGLATPAAVRRLEVLPYAVATASFVDPGGNPLLSDRSYAPTAGVDAKYRVSSNFTLDATVNPDFGQVEADPAEVNLSALETFFEERRPFFVEGREIFRFGDVPGEENEIYYSRRIGRAPQVTPGSAHVDVPDAARILGAAKLTGRTPGGWSLGMLGALTRRERGRYLERVVGIDPVTGTADTADVAREAAVEPATLSAVLRARKELRGGRTVVGALATGMHRDLSDAPALRAALHGSALTGGLDFRHEWAERTWALSGFVAGSHVRGSPEAMLGTQQAPWRYYQRPDRARAVLDSSRTSMSGAAAAVELTVQRGRHWQLGAAAGTVGSGYEVNDLGYQSRAGRFDVSGRAAYAETRPSRRLRSWRVSLETRGEWDHAREHLNNRLYLGTEWEFLNYWTATLNLAATLRSLDDHLARGGPYVRRPGNRRVFVGLGTDQRRPMALALGQFYQADEARGWRSESWVDVSLRPSAGIAWTLSPLWVREVVPAQYVATIADPAATGTFGSRYVFARLDGTTLSVVTRLDLTFSPRLSLQIYAQPFLSTGSFDAPSQLARPRTLELLRYGRDLGTVTAVDGGYEVSAEGTDPFFVPDHDYNFRSLRGTAVLRWDWRRGSSLYLAWQQDRSDDQWVRSDLDPARDASRLFSAAADDFIVVKVSYWINP